MIANHTDDKRVIFRIHKTSVDPLIKTKLFQWVKDFVRPLKIHRRWASMEYTLDTTVPSGANPPDATICTPEGLRLESLTTPSTGEEGKNSLLKQTKQMHVLEFCIHQGKSFGMGTFKGNHNLGDWLPTAPHFKNSNGIYFWKRKIIEHSDLEGAMDAL